MAWARLDDGFGDHPKVLDLIDTLDEMAGAAAIGLWTLALAYAHGTMRTAKVPGFVPRSFVRRACVPASLGDRLVDVGLWEQADGGWLIHDFGDYLPSEELRAKRAEAGRRGARARWEREAAAQDADAPPPEDESAGADSNLPSDATWQEGKKCPEPEPEPEPKKSKDQSILSATASPPPDAPPQGVRDDIERICAHLADRIEGNGSRRPAVTAKWRTAARLMLDADKRTEADIHAAIDWCQNSTFWRANILSLPKLRDKYDQLRLQATQAATAPPRPASNTAYLAASMERALAAEAAEANNQPTLWKALPA